MQYRDKYPRTLQEAFGPYASDDFEEVHQGPTLKGYAISIAVALFIGFLSWACQR